MIVRNLGRTLRAALIERVGEQEDADARIRVAEEADVRVAVAALDIDVGGD